jgi:hypothetical protein
MSVNQLKKRDRLRFKLQNKKRRKSLQLQLAKKQKVNHQKTPTRWHSQDLSVFP